MTYVLECLIIGYTRRAYRSPQGLYATLERAQAVVNTYGATWEACEFVVGKYRYPMWQCKPFGKPVDNHAWYRISPEDWKPSESRENGLNSSELV